MNSTTGQTVRLAAYCRVSTGKEEQLDSLEHQKQFFAEYAEAHGCQLVRLYADEGISGTSLRKRDEFLRLLQDARRGLFDTVAVKDISRFARNTVDFLQSIRELKALGINTIFITANMESLGESEFVLTIFGAMAQEESASLSKRVRFGKRLNAEKGRVPQRIFGYDRIDNFTLRINDGEAETVREIYRLYLEKGLGCRTISLQLNREGRKTKCQCEWNPRGVRRILENPIYCGQYVNHKYEVEDYLTGKQIFLPKEQQFHHDRPEWAIISPETYRKARIQAAARRAQYGSKSPIGFSARHRFSTLIRCEHCGRSFCRKQYTYANTRVYWTCTTNDQLTAERCGNRVKLEEDLLCAQISKYLVSLIPDKAAFIAGIAAELEQRQKKTAFPDKRKIEKQMRELLTRKERYQELYAEELITMTELKEKLSVIAERLHDLETHLQNCRKLPEIPEHNPMAERCTAEIEKFLSLESATNLELRKLLDHISVNQNGTVRIFLKDLGHMEDL